MQLALLLLLLAVPIVATGAAAAPGDDARTQADDAARTQADDAARTQADDAARTQAGDAARTQADDAARTQADDAARTQAGDAARTQADDAARTQADDAARIRADDEHVVLLHGLGRSGRSMAPLARRIEAGGYRVHVLDYPSRSAAPEEIVARLHEQLDDCCSSAERVHFVTHSLGGILVRAYVHEHAPAKLGRVVMLAPPNRGSEYVDIAERWNLASFLGPTGRQLGTAADSLPNRLPPPDFELGVIAGTGGFNPLGNAVLPGENDGTVSVASTRVDGVRDFTQVHVSHTFIMRDDRAAELTLRFLREGRFAEEAH